MNYKLLLAVTFLGFELAGGIHSGGGDGDPKLKSNAVTEAISCAECGGGVGYQQKQTIEIEKGNTNLSSGAGASS